jgi:hypothetical protein
MKNAVEPGSSQDRKAQSGLDGDKLQRIGFNTMMVKAR